MSSFYRADVENFLALSEEQIHARLQIAYAQRGFTSQYTDQTLTWQSDIRSLRESLIDCVARSPSAHLWKILLEFSIPRKEKRIDVVLLVRDAVVILEAKAGVANAGARRQIEEYALLLHYFHKASDDRRIVPILVSSQPAVASLTALRQREFFPQLPTYWIAPVMQCSWTGLSKLLIEIERDADGQSDGEDFDHSPYHPVPGILEAAIALKSGLSIREIAHSEASEHEISEVRETIQGFVDSAREQHQHAICFLTGVPGSGKTLVGLSLARLRAEGLEPSASFHAEYPWEHWYLADATDVRSSHRCEVFATEFEIQGLELDWIGLCWGGDFVWTDGVGWQLRTLRHGRQSKWSTVKSAEKRNYRRNAYRVLLTRARKGMVIYIPEGSKQDATRQPEDFDATARYLVDCGVTPMTGWADNDLSPVR